MGAPRDRRRGAAVAAIVIIVGAVTAAAAQPPAAAPSTTADVQSSTRRCPAAAGEFVGNRIRVRRLPATLEVIDTVSRASVDVTVTKAGRRLTVATTSGRTLLGATWCVSTRRSSIEGNTPTTEIPRAGQGRIRSITLYSVTSFPRTPPRPPMPTTSSTPSPSTSIPPSTSTTTSPATTTTALATTTTALPTTTTTVAPAPTVTAITGGSGHTCVLTSTGSVYCWGPNDLGQLGNGTTDYGFRPTAVTGIDDATAIAAGFNTTCALRTGGTVWCWGNNDWGQFGTRSISRSSTPVQVAGINVATQLVLTANEVCALKAGAPKEVWCWGLRYGIGNIGSYEIFAPTFQSGLTNPTSLYASDASTNICAIHNSGRTICWGSLFGLVPVTDSGPAMLTMSGISNAVSMGMSQSTCVILTTGALQCLGNNDYGTVGNGTYTYQTTPVTLTGLDSGVAQVDGGNVHMCALKTAGTVWCWGSNRWGQLGNGTTDDSATPVQVSGLTDAVAIATTYDNSCALRSGGGVVCWGLKDRLGNNSILTGPDEVTAPVAVKWN